MGGCIFLFLHKKKQNYIVGSSTMQNVISLIYILFYIGHLLFLLSVGYIKLSRCKPTI